MVPRLGSEGWDPGGLVALSESTTNGMVKIDVGLAPRVLVVEIEEDSPASLVLERLLGNPILPLGKIATADIPIGLHVVAPRLRERAAGYPRSQNIPDTAVINFHCVPIEQ